MVGRIDGRNRVALSENYRGNFAGRMILTARWKYFFYTNGEKFLQRMENDAGEETNLVTDPQHRADAAELKQRASPAGCKSSARSLIVGLPDEPAQDAPKAKRKQKKQARRPNPF